MTASRPAIIIVVSILAAACTPSRKVDPPTKPLTELSNLYTYLESETVYSQHVLDSFKIFKAIPEGFSNDSLKTYPLIIILDANAFFESTVAQLKFNSFVGLIPKAVVIGVGYRDFQAMDSLRSRDYTYPVAIPEYEMALSGGAERMKEFIDGELLPKITSEFKTDTNKTTICGHSLGAYFALFYALRSISDNSFPVKNIVAASPSLHYNKRFLFDMEKNITKPSNDVPMKIYISMGTEDMSDEESNGILNSFGAQITHSNYRGINIKIAEYSNFGHIDAAVPGFVKGLTFIYGD